MKVTARKEEFCRPLGDKRIRTNGCRCWTADGKRHSRFTGFTIKMFKHAVTIDFGKCNGCDAPF